MDEITLSDFVFGYNEYQPKSEDFLFVEIDLEEVLASDKVDDKLLEHNIDANEYYTVEIDEIEVGLDANIQIRYNKDIKSWEYVGISMSCDAHFEQDEFYSESENYTDYYEKFEAFSRGTIVDGWGCIEQDYYSEHDSLKPFKTLNELELLINEDLEAIGSKLQACVDILNKMRIES